MPLFWKIPWCFHITTEQYFTPASFITVRNPGYLFFSAVKYTRKQPRELEKMEGLAERIEIEADIINGNKNQSLTLTANVPQNTVSG